MSFQNQACFALNEPLERTIKIMYFLAFAESIQLFPDGTLFLHVAMILAMIWILNRTLYRPINRIIEAREKNKGGHSSEAEGIFKDVLEKRARYAKEMLDTRSIGYELIEKEQKKAVTVRDKKLGETKAEVAQMLDKGRVEIEKQAAEVHAAIGADAEKFAEQIAANILKA
jgi:F-type H+-transporting ATPase subunit b